MRSIVPNQCTASTSGPHGHHAEHGLAVARTLAAVDGLLAVPTGGRGARRPFWLAGPCPSWCDAVAGPVGHGNRDAFEDRCHTLFGAEVALTLYQGEGSGEDVDAFAPVASLMAAQHYLAAVATVALTVPLVGAPGGRCEEEVRLTVAEARALRDALTELLAAVDGAAAGAAGGAS
ncbi:MAG: DUF6907 domain-containing protein [Actinocrinis sp.]